MLFPCVCVFVYACVYFHAQKGNISTFFACVLYKNTNFILFLCLYFKPRGKRKKETRNFRFFCNLWLLHFMIIPSVFFVKEKTNTYTLGFFVVIYLMIFFYVTKKNEYG